LKSRLEEERRIDRDNWAGEEENGTGEGEWNGRGDKKEECKTK
jgi:hypothetical protein